ncbi:hypothetical protein JTE90_001466 [Oedothorax gibbosus]|uniref:BHLH domain-containing protein n=1 Tax=Oedothorax gibbosus TaxID=931172 RepID=A0AAV6UCN7_9ARAC|nr:hypothetical protein JTE90_001466 [Oedothorax gibbosus]
MAPSGRKRQKSDQKAAMKEIIHSGHFMVSDIDDPEVQDGDDTPSMVVHESDCDQESLPLPEKGFDFESACKETSKTYTFGSRSSHSISIDASLTKLFECMTLAYSGKLTSPRWKQFKGLKLRLKEKIRLNNMIWRAWHMQFIMRIQTDKLCQFATPLDGDTHLKPEACVIEGTYWKRRMANITAEYKKWRLFYRDQFRMKNSATTENMEMDWDTRWTSWPKDPYSSLQSAMDEDFIMDFTDTLFTSFNPSQPFDFPNPREIAAKAGIADFIQPGLVQLQPAVDDFMDTWEPLSDFLNSRLPPLPEETMYNSNSFQDMMQTTNEQQCSYSGSNSKSTFGKTASNVASGKNSFNILTRLNGQGLGNASHKRISNFKKPAQPSKPYQQSSYMPTPSFSGKPMMENINFNSANNSVLLTNDAPLMPSEQLTTQTDSMQPLFCSIVPNQPIQEPTIQSMLQNDARSLQQPPESLSSFQQASQMTKRESSKQFFQQQAAFKSFENTDLSRHQHMSQSSPNLQVPLQTIHQGQVAENIISIPNTNENKTGSHPLFFSVSLGQGSSSSSNNFKVPSPVSNILVASGYDSNLGKQVAAATHGESPAFRRHSYTTGQQASPIPQSSGDYMGARRSRPIAPAASSGNFAVPEVPSQNRRARSRSVSSPQSCSPKPVMQQPLQALSLTDISSPLQAVVSTSDLSGKRKMLPSSSHGQSVSNSNVLQQNALLAQLLTPDIGQTVIKVTNASATNVSSPVTIIRPILNTTAHTFVFSPVSISPSSGVNDLQRSIFVSSNNSPLTNVPQSSPPPCAVPSPESPGSSTCSSSPAISTVSFDSNSSSKTVRLKSDEEKIQYKEHRRVCHINAEQKRRCNIKNGFEQLHGLLPPIGQSPSSKVSKAAMLQRGAEYIRTLKTERQHQQEEAEMLKKQIDELNMAISLYQSQLPASGAPIPCQRTNRMKEMFEAYVRTQTLQNWKFYIFSLIISPLVESFNNNVSTANVDELCKSILTWLEQHCSLVALRPRVLNSLRQLSTSTSILSDPSRVPEEAIQAVTKKENRQ